MKILIRFAGDNDFSTVVKTFADLMILDSHREWNFDILTPERIAKWFNTVSGVLYHMVQQKGNMQFRADRDTDADAKRTGEYLQIEARHVYVGKDAEDMMNRWSEWGNCDGALVDLKNKTCTIV